MPASPLRFLKTTKRVPGPSALSEASTSTAPAAAPRLINQRLRINAIYAGPHIRLVLCGPGADKVFCIDALRYSGKPPFHLLVEQQLLGNGTYGSVRLVEHAGTAQLYALKVMPKRTANPRFSEVCLRERQMLALVSDGCPWVMNLVETYQDANLLYMLTTFCDGCEMAAVLRQHTPLPMRHTLFYVGAVVLMFEFLHSKRVVYRDLKPENLMLDEFGFPVLVDFGFAKVLEEFDPRSYTVCGTPQYAAPEVVLRRAHGFAYDWWTVGVFAYECLTGFDPFSDYKDRDALQTNITQGKYKWPSASLLSKQMSPDGLKRAKDFVQQLLNVDPARRLGSVVIEPAVTDGEGAAIDSAPAQVKRHPFFHVLPSNSGSSSSGGGGSSARGDAPAEAGAAAADSGVFMQALAARRVPPPLVPTEEDVEAARKFATANTDPLKAKLVKRKLKKHEIEDFDKFAKPWAVTAAASRAARCELEHAMQLPADDDGLHTA